MPEFGSMDGGKSNEQFGRRNIASVGDVNNDGLNDWIIERFNEVERFAHWLMAATFIILALTGLNLLIESAIDRR